MFRADAQRRGPLRQLRFESLEPRQVLATVAVSVATDLVDWGLEGGIQGLIDDPGDDEKISLREAILAANASNGADEIIFDPSEFPINSTHQIQLGNNQGDIDITDAVTITGLGRDVITIIADTNSRIFDIDDGNSAIDSAVSISGLTFTGGDVSGGFGANINGGAISTIEPLTLADMRFVDNEATGSGGALYADGFTTLAIRDTIFEDNFADGAGGAISLRNSATDPTALATIERVVFDANEAGATGGGAVFANLEFTTFELRDSEVTGNTTTGRGGGINFNGDYGSRLLVAGSTISGNIAGSNQRGGGVLALLGRLGSLTTFEVVDSDVLSNESGDAGGGIYVNALADTSATDAELAITISRSVISGNTTESRGGGLYVEVGNGRGATVEDSQITGNRANASSSSFTYGNGGGIYAFLHKVNNEGIDPEITVSRSTVDDNEAQRRGGGIFVCSKLPGTFLAVNSTISGNRTLDSSMGFPYYAPSDGHGGGVYVARIQGAGSLDVTFRNVTITDNESDTGGGVRIEQMSSGINVEFANSIVSENFVRDTTTPNNIVAEEGQIDATNTLYNLIGSGSTILDISGNPVTLSGTNLLNNDTPMLAGLALNGGLTPTHRLLETSPAVDSGSDALAVNPLTSIALATDQRGEGFVRVFDIPGVTGSTIPNAGNVDIGAYEVQLPKIIDVVISREGSSHEPFSFAEAMQQSDWILGNQLTTVPVGGIDTVTIQFSEQLSAVSEDDLALVGLRFGLQPTKVYNDDYDSITSTASWKFTGWGGDFGDQYGLLVSDDLVDLHGQALDGEWTNPASVFTTNTAVNQFPSGDGVAGGGFGFTLTILPGDANQSNVVDLLDLDILGTHFEDGPKSWSQANFNGEAGDGNEVNLLDLDLLGIHFEYDLRVLLLGADFDGDYEFDDADRATLLSNYTQSGNATFADGDLDGDGNVDDVDRDIFDAIDSVFEDFGIDLVVAV